MNIAKTKLFHDAILKVIKKKKAELHEPFFDNTESKLLKKSIKNKFISSKGTFVNQFEKKIKKITKSKYVTLTSSGTAALHLALLSLGVKSNHEVLMPTLNYIASANTTLYCGAIPHFIDSDESNLAIDPIKLEKYLNKICLVKNNLCTNKNTGNIIKVLICFHPYGYSAEIEKIKKICKTFKIKLIEDAAESIGSFFKGKHLGTFGDVGIISFNGNKTITTGSGGAIITDTNYLNKFCKISSSIAKKPHSYEFDYYRLGYNYRMANLNAAVGVAQIDKLNSIIKKKKNLYLRYLKVFKKIDFAKIYQPPKNSKSNYWLITAILNHSDKKFKNKILDYCNKKQIRIRPSFKLLHTVSYLNKFPKMNLSNSIKLNEKIISLPSSSFL
jgi:aminotransferase in exopolysaccharide biosynthesis